MTPGLMHHGLESAAHRYPDHPAVLTEDERWTFAELDRAANAAACHFALQGVGPGSRLAVMTSNRPEFVVVVHALSKLGAVPVLLNSAWKALEVETALGLTGAAAAVADGSGVELLAAALGPQTVLDLDRAEAAAVCDRTYTAGPPGAGPGPGDDAVFVFSSGTTDRPKAVRHTHRSITLGTAHWVQALGLGHEDRFQVATPPSRILGLLNLLAAAAAGATVRLHRRFDLDAELAAIQDDRMTLEMAVAPIALAMANHPDLESYDLSSLRYVMWGATPVTPAVAETVSARSGVRWLPAYGTSEVPVLAANPVGQPERWRLNFGWPARGRRGAPGGRPRQRRRPARGRDRRSAGPQRFGHGGLPARRGHRGRVRRRLVPHGRRWLARARGLGPSDRPPQGDDQGERVPGRAGRDRGGPARAHRRGRLRGVRSPRRTVAGEVPVAAVQLAPDAAVGAEDLQGLVADALAGYKRLHHVVLVDAVPRTPSGKVLRRTLRDEWSGCLSPAAAGTG